MCSHTERYGAGIMLYTIPEGPGTMIGHSGGARGCRAVVAYLPADTAYVAVLFNDEMAPRVLLACLSYMMVGAVIVWLIWRHGYPDYLPAVLVFTVVNILLYGFNLVRMGALLGGEVRVLMDQHAVNVLPFLSILNAKGDSLRRRWEGNFAGASAPLVLNVLLDHLQRCSAARARKVRA
mgnify:CR=1 FL=1